MIEFAAFLFILLTAPIWIPILYMLGAMVLLLVVVVAFVGGVGSLVWWSAVEAGVNPVVAVGACGGIVGIWAWFENRSEKPS